MQNELIIFLESFEHTGIYIIDKTTLQVYYENEVAKKYTGTDRIGKPCYQVHGNVSMCASCPLRREDKTSYVIREDMGMIFIVQAIEMKWQGQDAFSIFVRKQQDIKESGSLNEDMARRMNRALNTSVLTYCEVNMKTLHSKSIHFSDTRTNHVIENRYDIHLKEMCEYYVYPQDQERVKEAIGLPKLQALSADSNGPSKFSIRYRSSGRGISPIVIESTAYILRNELPHYVTIITREVTEEELLNMKLLLYNEVTKNTISVFRLNLTQDRYIVSGGTRVFFSKTKDELDECHTLRSLFSYIIDHVSEEEQKRAEEFFDVDHMLRDFEAGQKLFRHRVPVLMGDGTYRWLQIEIDMIRNPLTGDVEGIMKSEEIEETIVKENMITQVINNDYDYIILIDLGNNSAKAFTNNGLYKPKETDNAQGYIDEYIRRTYVGDDLDTFIQENQFEYIHKRLEKQEKYVIYYYVCEKDGHVRYKKGTYSYPNGDKRYLIFSRFDNTEAIEEQKKINEQLKIALQDSAKANEAKTEIFSRMSHDLRTPMNAIVGMAKLGLDESKDENSRHYFEKIDTSGNYLLGLINDILDMNRLEHEKVVLKEEAADGMEFLYDVVAMMQPLIEQRRINLVTDFSGIRERYLFCDVIRTRQIFVNFLSNAVKFSKPGQTVEWTCKDSKVEDGRVYYEMKFRDYGCGMSKEFLPRVFEPFEQEVNQYSGENPSTGLGLAITKNLVSAMGGDISVESELGQGTTFTLHLSHRLAKASDVKKGIEKVNYEMLSGKRILVVEDHPLNMEIEKKLLEKQAIEVTTANNGLEGVNAFENSPLDHFDAVIMDVRMPVMDGLEATRRIRALPRADAKKVVILATTANAFAEDVKKCLDAGMNAHLAKPIEPKLLYEMLGRLIP